MPESFQIARLPIKEEEKELFPDVRKALGRARLNDIGEDLARAKKIAPTSPHPRSPSTPPGNLVAAEFRGPNQNEARTEVIQRIASVCGIVPADVVFLSPGSLPRTSSGKLRRLEVRRSLELVD